MKLTSFILATMCIIAVEAQELKHGLVGFAATPAYGIEGTIGGGLGEIVYVTNEADLRKYCKAKGPYIILFEGNITLTNEQDITITSDKTIIGLNGNAVLDGIGFDAKEVSNVIIRGFTIRNAHADAIAFRTSNHVWIDHCDLSASDDGLLDFTIGSDRMTASWNRFHNHDKVSVCNSGTQHYEDVGKQKVSYHHNSFINTTQRNPRIGYGRGHVWNNYYENVSSYCVGYFTGAKVIIERNYFNKCKTPLKQMYSSDPASAHYGEALSVDNIFSGCSGNTTGTGSDFDVTNYYDYTTTLDAASDVPSIVKASAGPIKGLEYDLVPLPNSGRIDVATSKPLLKWSKAPGANSYDVYLSTSVEGLSTGFLGNVNNNHIQVDKLNASTTYYWRVDTHLSDTKLTGAVWQFTTADNIPTKPYPKHQEDNAQLQAQKDGTSTEPMTLTWAPAFDAEGYEVTLNGNGEVQTIVLDANTTSWQPETLLRGIEYTWMVKPIINEKASNDSPYWSFSAPIVKAKEGINEAESWTTGLRAYVEVQDGAWFLASGKKVIGGESGPGTLNAAWDGEHVESNISVCMFDESDGKGTYKLFINDQLKGRATATQNNDKLVTYELCSTELFTNDQIRLEFAPEGGEGCRTDYIKIEVTNRPAEGISDIRMNERENKSYNLSGLPVNNDYKGVVIGNKKKMFIK